MDKKRYEQRKQIKSARWLIFWVVLAHLAADVAVQAVVSFLEYPPHEYLQIGISELIALGIPIIVYGRAIWQGSAETAGRELMLTACRPTLMLAAMVIGIGGQFVMMLLNIPANVFSIYVLKKVAADAVPVAVETGDLILGIITVVIIPAVLEEFWLRGLVFRAYNKCNTSVAVLFTTLVFAFVHIRFNEICGFLFMGFMAVFILMRTRSLFAAIVYHGFSNLTALLFGYFLPYILSYLGIIFAAAIVLFIAGVILLFITGKPMPKVKLFRGSEIFIKSIFSIPMLLSIAVVILRIFIIS